MKPIIEVKGLSKKYKLGVFNAKTLREEAEAFLARFARKKLKSGNAENLKDSPLVTRHPSLSSQSDEFWALRDVSFDVQPGEVIGVIGRNGAGKSTLLKILSRITEPTSGEVRIRGRVASLLEVGTGFHAELTGRENIFLNGAILGMSKAEIRSKFDEIVAFAEIEKFIDTPVKRYSSGMYVRLAFAVAAHLEPEILIVDEVLAVGDVEFQKKCIGKMQDVSRGGRTVLFVSHNMSAIERLCQKVVMLKGGQVFAAGPVHEVTQMYLASARDEMGLTPEQMKGKSLEVRALRFEVSGDDLHAEMDVLCDAAIRKWGVGFQFESMGGDVVSVLRPPSTGLFFDTRPDGNSISIRFPGVLRLLPEGDYMISVWFVGGKDSLLALRSAYCLRVPPNDPYGTGRPFVQGADGFVVVPVEDVDGRTTVSVSPGNLHL